ncbi:hypothetical protein EIN_344580 [Entamoeba invadens IP1]|uniref:UDENN domain-containing protein n=1 Tax=Entamoeba invadens IP1 TaxID=370355 RepID=A0A0A1U958_ENTIV|nr:hypothetical protein EIN_344580 [Entamoeba invadens IP1]ELP88508.1 hypothetical protein EIN_344580 [Entamoeba invadens IP1]|eukprot:XP_004255279.1 hypothetical protein EIN_344580 [Entamoeba invadens IP1]
MAEHDRLTELMSSPFERSITLTSSYLVSSFSIWGLPPNFKVDEFTFWKKSYSYDAQMLYCSKNAELQQHFAKFIAPQPVTVTNTNKLDILMTPPKKYLLILPGETTTSFCACIVRKELLPFPSDFVQETKLQQIYTYGNNQLVTDRIYCFVSEFPFINALFAMLEDMERYDFHSKLNYIRTFYLRNGGNPTEKYVSDKARMEAYLSRVLKVQAPSLTQIEYPIEVTPAPIRYFTRTSIYSTYPTSDQMPACCLNMIGDYALCRMFVGLQPSVIFNALASLLTGSSVILVGSNASLITSSVFGLLTLMYPFIWQGVLIPFVPVALQEFLESPVPSLYGTEIPTDVTRVNANVYQLEHGNLFDPNLAKKIIKTIPSVQHSLPFLGELTAAVNSCVVATFSEVTKLKSFEERERALEKIPQEKLVRFSTEVIQAVKHQFYDKILTIMKNFCMSHGPIDLTDFKRKFPQLIKHETHKRFIIDMIESQHFNVWWYRNKMSELTSKIVQHPSPTSFGGSRAPSVPSLSPCRTPDIRPEEMNKEAKMTSPQTPLDIEYGKERRSIGEKTVLRSDHKSTQKGEHHITVPKNEKVDCIKTPGPEKQEEKIEESIQQTENMTNTRGDGVAGQEEIQAEIKTEEKVDQKEKETHEEEKVSPPSPKENNTQNVEQEKKRCIDPLS